MAKTKTSVAIHVHEWESERESDAEGDTRGGRGQKKQYAQTGQQAVHM